MDSLVSFYISSDSIFFEDEGNTGTSLLKSSGSGEYGDECQNPIQKK